MNIDNQFFLICFLVLIVVFPSSDRHFPVIFRQVPTVYYASQVILAVGFFTSFVGLVSSNSSQVRGHMFSKFCSFYCGACLGLFLILLGILTFVSEFDVPFWYSNQVYAALIRFTHPLPLFVLLIGIALPLPFLVKSVNGVPD